MRHSSTNYFHKDDITDYGPLIEVIMGLPKLLQQFHTFKREKEARARQDRRHLAFYIPSENAIDEHNTLTRITELERNDTLRKAIAKLTSTQKRRVILRFWYELTYKQIAELENTSRTAVRKSITLALKKIKEFYD